MGGASLRRACGLALVIGAIGVMPATAAGAVTLGNPDMDYATSDFGAGCGQPGPTCIFMQKLLPGAEVRAPFSGEIVEWQMAQPGPYTAQLVVMRKRDNGRYEAIRASETEATPSPGSYAFDASLKIKKGDLIAIHSASLVGRFNTEAKILGFSSPLELGDPQKPDYKTANEYLYNAKLKR